MTRRLAIGLVLIVALATPAYAHVTVNPREANQGSYVKLAFRVPNERDDSGTTKLAVRFPAEHPLRSVSIRPTPGWKATVERTKLGEPLENDEGEGTATDFVSTITWDGGVINPGEFQEFEVSVGPLPDDVDQLVFKAVQTYASGEVVSWIEVAGDDEEEPDHPAPVLKLVAGDGGQGSSAGSSGGGDDGEEAAEDATETATAAGSEAGDRSLNVAWVVVFIAAMVALVLGLMGATRRRTG